MDTAINKQKGFTLVEIAIVLVIIGLLLGGVLKGQELINGAKIKNLYNLKDQMATAYLNYYDRYNAFPGDDNLASTNLNDGAIPNGNGNGLIGGGAAFNCTNASAQESCLAFQHMRAAGLISGAGRSNPKNPYGGSVTVADNTYNGTRAHWVQFDNVPSDAAQIIDRKYDDGVFNSGTVQASADYTGAIVDLRMEM